jgi:hypothetical protein
MAEWGRKEYQSWPSRKPVWTLGAFLLTLLVIAGAVAWEYARQWSFAEREYLRNYLLSETLGTLREKGHYRFVTYLDKKGVPYIASGDEIERVKMPDGSPGYRLTEAGVKAGAMRLQMADGVYSNAWMRQTLGHVVYQDQTAWEYIKKPVYGSLPLLALLLFVAVPKDRKRALVYKHGRRLRGPELVTTAEFNERLGQKKGLRRYLPDGLAFINENQSWAERTFSKNETRWVRLPREREAMHFLIVGDSGHGKSAIVRQALTQIWERGETAIIYDPAMEYLPQFYDPRRGDVILNPLDARCPFWTPGDEVPHQAEALTLAASLFPDQGRENRFFVDAPRKIFAHLLSLKPTPEQLTAWLASADEIDRRVKDTELAAMIDPHGGPQRSGVLGSLNMVADAFKLLPTEAETERRWSAAAWAKERKGWVFITSKPTVRERLRPLISLWLDLLVLRTMDDGATGKRKTWFVLDELASLQRLPQLTTAVTESRKSNSPMVLGFQGKAQIEALYGHIAESLLSQPATKIYLKTSEPQAAEWISKAIGEVEIERCRETRTHGQFPQNRNSESQQREITREPLVMASEIGGLDPLHGFLKHGNYVVRLRVPYLQLEAHHEKFIERRPKEDGTLGQVKYVPPSIELPRDAPGAQMEIKPLSQNQGQQHFYE